MIQGEVEVEEEDGMDIEEEVEAETAIKMEATINKMEARQE